jgi:hypothetical protein
MKTAQQPFRVHFAYRPALAPADAPYRPYCNGGAGRLRVSDYLTHDPLEVTCRRCARMIAPLRIKALNEALEPK